MTKAELELFLELYHKANRIEINTKIFIVFERM